MTRIQKKYNEGGFGAALAEYDKQMSVSWYLGILISYGISCIVLCLLPESALSANSLLGVFVLFGSYVLLWLLCVVVLRWNALKGLQELQLRSWFQQQTPTLSSTWVTTDSSLEGLETTLDVPMPLAVEIVNRNSDTHHAKS